MAQIFRIRDLEQRKKALVAESEVYRQTLKLEVQNIRLYGVRMQRKFALVRLANPLFLVAGSFRGSRVLGRKSKLRRRGRWSMFGIGLMAWRLARNYGPFLKGALGQIISSPGAPTRPRAEDHTPAANI